MRARQCHYDAREQIKLRLRVLSDMGHPTDKIELIIMGGTFLACPPDYQYQFIKDCYDALNEEDSATLEDAKRRNETANHRCTGLCVETRPDWCGQEEIDRMLDFGVTRVELGVQILDDDIYRLVKRGHGVEDVVRATTALKEHGFKIHYHWMPGLPGSSPEADLELTKKLFSDPRFRPDGLKLYPTMVVAGTELEKWYQDGQYQTYDAETMIKLLVDIKTIVPKYIRISRVLRDIPPKFIVAGLKDSLRDALKQRMADQAAQCKCIRCREYGHRARDGWDIGEPRLVRMDYDASEGKEIILSFEDDAETLFGLLRMRVPAKSVVRRERRVAGNITIIRELHVYGPEVALCQREVTAAQHKGLGKTLLKEAERIAAEEFQSVQMAVLSGVGAREYYRTEFGYHLRGDYLIKSLRGN